MLKFASMWLAPVIQGVTPKHDPSPDPRGCLEENFQKNGEKSSFLVILCDLFVCDFLGGLRLLGPAPAAGLPAQANYMCET